MMFECPHCKTFNGVSAFTIANLHDFDTHDIQCAKCETIFTIKKMVEYIVLEE